MLESDGMLWHKGIPVHQCAQPKLLRRFEIILCLEQFWFFFTLLPSLTAMLQTAHTHQTFDNVAFEMYNVWWKYRTYSSILFGYLKHCNHWNCFAFDAFHHPKLWAKISIRATNISKWVHCISMCLHWNVHRIHSVDLNVKIDFTSRFEWMQKRQIYQKCQNAHSTVFVCVSTIDWFSKNW